MVTNPKSVVLPLYPPRVITFVVLGAVTAVCARMSVQVMLQLNASPADLSTVMFTSPPVIAACVALIVPFMMTEQFPIPVRSLALKVKVTV